MKIRNSYELHRIDKTVILAWIGLGLAAIKYTGGISPPSGARIESYDLDFTVKWDPPADINETVNISYTVLYAERTSIYLSDSLWVEVDTCTNITETQCNVTGVIDHFRDFTSKCIIRVRAMLDGVRSKPLQVDLFPRRNAHISPPTVNVSEVTDSYLSLHVFGPLSPYRDEADNTKTLRVEEVDPLLKGQIYFNIVLEGETLQRTVNTSARYPMVEFHDLPPGANYTISSRSIYNGLYRTTCSPEPSVSTVSTALNDKLHRPLDVELVELPIDCNYPDMRDVVVTWKRPLSYEPIPFYDLKYWILGQEHGAMSFVIQREINRTKYSFRLRNLPRWSMVKVTVSANTSIAGCSSFESALFQHVVGDESSRPENLSFSKPAADIWTFVWDAPSSCAECIAWYEVSWGSTLEGDTKNLSRDIVSVEELKYQIQTEIDVTLVTVTTLLRSGTYTTKRGQQAVLGIQYEESTDFFKVVIICLVGLIVFMVGLLIFFFKMKSKRRWKDNPSIIEILSSKSGESETQLFRQYSSTPPLREYSRSVYVKEPEVFDELLPAPSSQEKASSIPLKTLEDKTEPESREGEPGNSTPT